MYIKKKARLNDVKLTGGGKNKDTISRSFVYLKILSLCAFFTIFVINIFSCEKKYAFFCLPYDNDIIVM